MSLSKNFFSRHLSPDKTRKSHLDFRIPRNNIDILPIGCDTYSVDLLPNKQEIRKRYKIPENVFVIVSGGKMDNFKGTPNLIKACSTIYSYDKSIHLVLFGKVDQEVARMIECSSFITFYGWCNREKTLSLLKMSDVGCWPFLHTTLIEDAVSCGLPLITKASRNVCHFQIYGNGIFLNKGDEKEIIQAIELMKADYLNYYKMGESAKTLFSYDNISRYLEEYPNNTYTFDYDNI